jgi:hypothetical protein
MELGPSIQPATSRERDPLVVIDEAQIRQLASLDLGAERVTTCYLDLDGRRVPRSSDLEGELQRILRDGRARAHGDPSVLEDLRRIEAHVRAGIERRDSRGLVMVCCSTASLWEAIPVPVSLRSQLVITHGPALGQLEAMVHEAEAIAVVLADADRARIVVFQLGAVVRHHELDARTPVRPHDGGAALAGPSPAQRAAEVLGRMHHEDVALDAVVLAAADAVVAEFDHSVDPELAKLRAGRLSCPVTVSVDELRASVAELEIQLEAERQVRLVSELRASLARRDGAVAGLPATLHALSAGRVEHLLVSAGYQATGWRSLDGRVLAAVGPRCDLCSEMMVRTEDVVEEAIELALASGTRITVLTECDDLDVLGHIGGLVRR